MGSVVDGVPVLMPPPEGYEVDFDNPQRQAVPLAYWVAGVGTVLSLIFVAQRLYTKLYLMKKMQADDVFLILSCIVSYVVIYFCVHMFAVGAGGVHTWEIPIPKYNIFMKDVYLAAAIYIVGGSFAKISLLIFYFRISHERWFAIATWSCIIFIAAYTIGIFFAVLLACLPMERNWNILITDAKCINQASLYIATAVTNIVSDVVIFCLPIPVVVGLQIPRQQKIGLILIFLLGSLTIVTSCIRVSILPEMFSSPDQPWVISYATVWILVESNLFIICASLPTMRKFLKHVASGLIGESAYGSGKGRSGYGTVGSSAKTGANTHRSQPSRNDPRHEYAKFAEEGDIDRANATRNETFNMKPYPGGANQSSAFRTSDEERTWVDDDSSRGIVSGKHIKQTTVVTVERS